MNSLCNLKPCFLAGSLGQGGAERQLFHILQALCQAGATPRLLALTRGEFWEEKIRSLGVPVTCVGDAASRWKRLPRIVKALRRDRPDILQSQHFFTNAYAGVASRCLRLPCIGAMRNEGRSEARACGRLGGWLNLRLPPTLAANSQPAIRFAAAHGVRPSRLHFLPNVVDTEWFSPVPPPKPPDRPLTLLAVGRLVSQKRMDRFIAILGRLKNEAKSNVRGLIVGSGRAGENLQPRLEDQAARLGLLPHALEFRPEVSDMRGIYRQATVCLLTSDHEGTPNVLLEAMASGLPVVATRVGGVPEIVRHGVTGFLREPEDLDNLVADTLELAANAQFREDMGRRARAFVEERHNLRRLPQYLAELYRRTLPEKLSTGFRVAADIST